MGMKAINRAMWLTFTRSSSTPEAKTAHTRNRIAQSKARLLLLLGILPLVGLSAAVGGTTFTQTNLVADIPGMARTTDPNLVNPWGVTLGLNSGIWVSDNGTGKATTYDGNGQPIPSGSPTIVIIPAPGGGTSAPTGVATNGTSGFVISSAGHAAPSTELFSTENGTIAGWSSSVDPTH